VAALDPAEAESLEREPDRFELDDFVGLSSDLSPESSSPLAHAQTAKPADSATLIQRSF
jgi:hypothetical protein